MEQDKYTKLSKEDALKTYCSECGAMPNELCVYYSNSPYYTAEGKLGQPTSKLHNRRYDNQWWRLYRWLSSYGGTLCQVGHLDQAVQSQD